jgi:hypothetical protein
MALTCLKAEYVEDDGVLFSMKSEDGGVILCRVSHEALRDHAERLHFAGSDGAVFETYRELIEDIASAAFDVGGPSDDRGRILVTSEAISRVTRSA